MGLLLSCTNKDNKANMISMAVGTIVEWLKLVPFFVRRRTVDWGGVAVFFKINILAVKHLKINILAWVPRKIIK